MQQVFDAVLQVAPSRATVLITGESGTGKELIAARDPRAQPARQEAVRQAALRGARRVAARERAVRPRARLVHRRRRAARGALRAGRRRHAVPRRDRRDLAGDPGQAAALSAGARVRARRRQPDDQGRRARHRRDQSQPAAAGQGGPVPRGSLLSAERRLDRDAAAARARVGHPAARVALPRQVRARERQERSTASPTTRWRSWPATTGRATCASWRTRSSARSSSARSRASASRTLRRRSPAPRSAATACRRSPARRWRSSSATRS